VDPLEAAGVEVEEPDALESSSIPSSSRCCMPLTWCLICSDVFLGKLQHLIIKALIKIGFLVSLLRPGSIAPLVDSVQIEIDYLRYLDLRAIDYMSVRLVQLESCCIATRTVMPRQHLLKWQKLDEIR